MKQQENPFSGNSLMQQYRIIASCLMRFERSPGYPYKAEKAHREFREGVAFLSVEVLESYLDDLLDPEVSLDRLSLKHKDSSFMGFAVVACIFLLTAILFIKNITFSLFLLIPVVVLLAGIGVTLFGSRESTRRLVFARVLSKEIFRRKGAGADGEAFTGSSKQAFFHLGASTGNAH